MSLEGDSLCYCPGRLQEGRLDLHSRNLGSNPSRGANIREPGGLLVLIR